MTAAIQGVIRFAAVAISAWAVSGAVALADGSSEYESLNSDPLEAMFGGNSDVDASEIELGSGNNVVVVQKGTTGNRIEIDQSGAGNLVIAAQTSLHTDNRAEIVQSGESNASVLAQYGSDNEYELLQTGNHNVSAAAQFGDNNRFEHVQNGDNLGFAVTQYGNSTIKVTQSGGY
ncbi:hypothetical protein [Henriciella sp.]|uniref:hypothetical protein n=1 Tax=Henriciella sp. TaxID=1968823 RepID=UPI002611820A|nr:hypothetical protein [Henriciella sp.]